MDLLAQLFNQVDGRIFILTLQIIATGAVAMYLKDLSSRLINFLKMKFSDFGRGTKVGFNGEVGYITQITFSHVEIRLSSERLFVVPISRFLAAPKIIYTKIPEYEDQS